MKPPAENKVIAEITSLHDEIRGLLESGLQKAMRIGELLAGQKARLKHGQWLPWVEANLPFNKDQAARYMRVSKNKEIINASSSTHLTEAVKMLAEPKKQNESSESPDLDESVSAYEDALCRMQDAAEEVLYAELDVDNHFVKLIQTLELVDQQQALNDARARELLESRKIEPPDQSTATAFLEAAQFVQQVDELWKDTLDVLSGLKLPMSKNLENFIFKKRTDHLTQNIIEWLTKNTAEPGIA